MGQAGRRARVGFSCKENKCQIKEFQLCNRKVEMVC